MKQPVLLCYNLDEDSARQVRLCAMRFRVRFCPVAKEQYAVPIGALCGLSSPEQAPAPQQGFDEPMLVMAFFPGSLMGLFLQGLRKAGIRPDTLKAMLTETNAAWDSLTLHQELCRERDAMQAGKKAHLTEA